MKCTDCHTSLAPVAIFDIDGTLAQYHFALAKFCIDYWDLRPALATYDLVVGWDGEGKFREALGLSQDDYREAKLAFRQGGMKRTMHPYYDGGFESIGELRNLGVEIWYVTARPWQRLDNVDPDTRFWLNRHHLPVDGLLFDESDKYGRLIRDHIDPGRIIGIVDDLPEQYDRCLELNLPVFQVARQHNSGPSAKRDRRGTMSEAGEWLRNQLGGWYK